jgi:hypothetical protein
MELQEKSAGNARSKALIDEYLATPDTFTGDSSAVQAAIGGLFTNAQRQATGSGANFTAMEMSLIESASVASKAGNLGEWIKRNALGRNQQLFAQTLRGLYQKTQDYEFFEGYGLKRKDVPLEYYPAPMRAKVAPSVSWDAPASQAPAPSGGSPAPAAIGPPRLQGESVSAYRQRVGL